LSISEINVRMTNVMKGCDEYFMYDPYEGKREGESRRDAVLGSANDAWRLTDKQTDRHTEREKGGREGGSLLHAWITVLLLCIALYPEGKHPRRIGRNRSPDPNSK